MIAEWKALEAQMVRVKATLPRDQLDSYFQLVEHPILALSNLYQPLLRRGVESPAGYGQ